MKYFNRTWRDPMSGIVFPARLLTKAEVEHEKDLMRAVRLNRSILESQKLSDRGRKGFRRRRTPMPGVCMSHMDTEPCATCWVPEKAA